VWASTAAAVLALVCVVLAVVQLATRPPCPPGYVRLVDLSWLGVALPAALGVVAVSLRLWIRRPGPHLVAAGVAALLVGLVGLACVGVAVVLHEQWGSQYDTGCWTF